MDALYMREDNMVMMKNMKKVVLMEQLWRLCQGEVRENNTPLIICGM